MVCLDSRNFYCEFSLNHILAHSLTLTHFKYYFFVELLNKYRRCAIQKFEQYFFQKNLIWTFQNHIERKVVNVINV